MTAKIMMFWLIGVALSISLLPDHTSSSYVEERHEIVTEVPFRDVKESPDDDENEVPSSREVVDEGWSAWGAWSPCSRSCNGGVSHRLRKCEQKIGCQGESIKYKICNMMPCPDSTDFRATQCAAYNHVPYRGRLYEWLPYQDPEDPCSLTCHARSHSFVAKLAPRVRDGTRCREGALDMCVDGKCMAVGCDLQLGSSKKVDDCGVCGGNGSTCRRPLYVWGKTPFSPCSVSCGGGYQMSRPMCLNKADEKEVDERLCDGTGRPVPEIKECNSEKCPPSWVTDSWSPCSSSCGGGRQSRQVHCAEMGADGIRSPVPQEHCLKQKPLTERPCNLVPCPRWVSGPWSGCSVTCGKGQKTRSVACRDARDQHNEGCEIEEMPNTRQPCDSGLVCTPSEDSGTYLFSDIFKGSLEDAPPRNHYWSYPVAVKSPDVSTEPSYVVGEWGPCSASCGQGFRQRTVDCKIFLEFSRTVAKLQDNECPGPRPPHVESCYIKPCSFDMNKQGDRKKPKGHVGIEVTYSWRSNGFTPCSASCLGGTRESVIQCVRDHDQAVVKATQCDITKKPDAITQTCNDSPCPPKWNISEFTPCSKSCGGGLMTRKVQCLHEVLRGAVNTLVVNNSHCPQPPPREQLYCNNFDCPQRWKPGNWSKCSKSCGGGVKIRKIHCMMQKAFGQEVELAPSNCSKLSPPKTQKICNMKVCPSYDDAIVPSHQSYVQQFPQRRVFLKVGGRAVVFAETNIKIRCPSKNVNKTGIIWYKNDQQITSSKRLKVSMKGALRIRKIALKDSGKYTCVSGYSKADIYITVKPLPSVIDEEKTVESLRPSVTETKDKERTSEEKHSHEFNRVNPPTDAKNQGTPPDKYRPFQQPKVNFGNSPEDTFEDNRKQYQYKTNLDNSQNSHQDFSNKAKSFSTEDTIVDFSTLARVPLYIQVRQTVKPMSNPEPTEKSAIKPLDSDELTPHRGSQEHDKNRQKTKTKPYSTSDDKSPNQVIPPRYGDTWKQTYDGAQRAKNKPKEVWDRNDGGALFSDQEELNVGTPHGGKGFPGKPAHSGASSTHGNSHIKNLLMNLPSLGTTRGILTDPDTDDTMDSFDDDDDGMYSYPTKMVANSFVLGKGKPENLEFEWVITEWSACSQSCGGTGFQVRASQCLVRLNNVSKTVDSTLCEDAGLPTPTTIQSCGYDDCPQWETAPWSLCLESQCFTWHTSYEKRAIFCRTSNGTDLPLTHCDEKTRPRRKRECYNSRCRSNWKVGDWSECTADCNRHGFQSRILQCVWFGSTRPAGNACRDQQRPLVMRPCKGPPCQSNGKNCTDRSSYCSLAKTLHLCRLSRYHLQCCDSCRTRESKG